jgi:hypothetical protein
MEEPALLCEKHRQHNVTTVRGFLMSSFWADPANLPHPTKVHPALTSFGDEVCATVARLFAYVGTLALLAILGIHGWDQLQPIEIDAPADKAGWSVADRSYPAFAISQLDPAEKSVTYTILRHPEGGRKDVLRWPDGNEKVTAELEIYRLGGENDPTEPPGADIAARMGLPSALALEPAGVIESKFGDVALLRQAGANDAVACLGFLKSIDDPRLKISGFSCQGDSLPARRAAVGCMLDRLMLLTAGNEPKLAELFASAELRRGTCATQGTPGAQADWVTSAENPHLRGPL